MERIGIAISTRNRESAFERTYEHILKFMPEGDVYLAIVDDASDTPCPVASYRFETNVGIPVAKNKAFELLYDAGCEHLFMFDNDAFPKCKDWHLPYINSEINHLCFTFISKYAGVGGRPKPKRWGSFHIHTLPNGCMNYYRRICLDTVGGMDTAYSPGFYEHVDLSRRIYNAGLTPSPYMDVIGSDQLIHSMDWAFEVERTFTLEQRSHQVRTMRDYFNRNARSKEYKEFRESVNQIA